MIFFFVNILLAFLPREVGRLLLRKFHLEAHVYFLSFFKKENFTKIINFPLLSRHLVFFYIFSFNFLGILFGLIHYFVIPISPFTINYRNYSRQTADLSKIGTYLHLVGVWGGQFGAFNIVMNNFCKFETLSDGHFCLSLKSVQDLSL